MSERRVALITGFPARLIARKLVATLTREGDGQVVCVVPARAREEAERVLQTLPEAERGRIELLEGDSAHMDFGLSGAEYRELCAKVTFIHHCAALTRGGNRQQAQRVHVEGARELLEFAGNAAGLQRLVHWSSARLHQADSARNGRDERLRSIDETRRYAEAMFGRATSRVPITILRPAVIVRTAPEDAISRLDGPYLLVMLILRARGDLPLLVPGHAEARLNMVPIDYVVAAGLELSRQPSTLGRTCLIADPHPPTAAAFCQQVAKLVDKELKFAFVPLRFANPLLNAPGLNQIAHAPRRLIEQLALESLDDADSRALLRDAGLICPSFESYAPAMIEMVRRFRQQHREFETSESAPLNDPRGSSS